MINDGATAIVASLCTLLKRSDSPPATVGNRTDGGAGVPSDEVPATNTGGGDDPAVVTEVIVAEAFGRNPRPFRSPSTRRPPTRRCHL